jgi:hypothetical protein
MPDEGFASGLWKNVRAVTLGEDGGIAAPVRANGRDGVVVGVDRVAVADSSVETPDPVRRGWWARLRRR